MKVLGISGFARSGKDLFANALQNILQNEYNLKTEKFALAYELKLDLKDLLSEKANIDVFTDDTNQKSTIRPILVAYGDVMRQITQGKYWTDKVQKSIEKSNADVCIITDIRYDHFPEDELYWLQKKMNGKLIHITKWHFDKNYHEKVYDLPPNDHEATNNPKIKSKADYSFEWEDFSSLNISKDEINNHPYITTKVKESLKALNLI